MDYFNAQLCLEYNSIITTTAACTPVLCTSLFLSRWYNHERVHALNVRFVHILSAWKTQSPEAELRFKEYCVFFFFYKPQKLTDVFLDRGLHLFLNSEKAAEPGQDEDTSQLKPRDRDLGAEIWPDETPPPSWTRTGAESRWVLTARCGPCYRCCACSPGPPGQRLWAGCKVSAKQRDISDGDFFLSGTVIFIRMRLHI